jgi:hypothetical protein
MALFARTNTLDGPDTDSPLHAYKEGRRDERAQVEAGLFDRKIVKKEMDEAYERGKAVGLARRRGSFLGGLSFLLLAVLVIAEAAMVIAYGSFGAAGAVVDQMLSTL